MAKIEPHGIEPPEPPIGWSVVLLAMGFVILMLAVFFAMSDEERYPPAKVVDVEIIKP